MTLSPPSPAADINQIRQKVDTFLEDFLHTQENSADLPELDLFIGLLRDHLAAGGKRIRPLMCITGWYTATDQEPPPLIYRAAASLELFHAFALIHDDIMDNSATRRGRPTAHRALAALHAHHPDPDTFGINAAILLGDLAFGWSYDLLHATSTDASNLTATWPVLNALRTETLIGQYLDLHAAGQPTPDATLPWRVIRYKTAKYTIERPLHLGASLAGSDPDLLTTLTAYALPLGEAFQLRDDLLGVFGDPQYTGKSTLEDLRDGKHTVLIATALARATPAQQHLLRSHLGTPQLTPTAATAIRDVLEATGARDTVEQMIRDRCHRALKALQNAPVQPQAKTHLQQMARRLTDRIS
ncbi:polyprenyl synthetase family protein [Streptomyces sp. NPDC007818]|uniref:polyprenyl synthetase family protein n=1 Tax=Streptomyces sp. NPDC007818 TaxID=3364780 RepID=UPI00367CAA04